MLLNLAVLPLPVPSFLLSPLSLPPLIDADTMVILVANK